MDTERIEKSVPLPREIMSRLPRELTEQIKEAIINGNIELMEGKIRQLPAGDQPTADKLLVLVKSYNFEMLNKLFQIT